MPGEFICTFCLNVDFENYQWKGTIYNNITLISISLYRHYIIFYLNLRTSQKLQHNCSKGFYKFLMMSTHHACYCKATASHLLVKLLFVPQIWKLHEVNLTNVITLKVPLSAAFSQARWISQCKRFMLCLQNSILTLITFLPDLGSSKYKILLNVSRNRKLHMH